MILGLAGMRLWGAIGAAVVVALFVAWAFRVNSLRATHLEERRACEANHKQFVADVQAKTLEAQRLDAEHKATVETNQDKITKESSSDYQAQLAALRARYDSLRVQSKAPANGISRGSSAPVPSVPETASGPDAAGAACDLNKFNAEANALQLGGLQNWVRDQEAIPR